MSPRGLLRLYPRAWRNRYGAEFLDTIGDSPLRAQQVIDIVMGAIDARMSATVRRSSAPAVAASKGGHMLAILKGTCAKPQMRMTTRDGLISAAVLLGCSVLFAAIGILLDRSGQSEWSDAVTSIGFPLSTLLSMPFGILKGQPWRAQALVIGGTSFILIAATYVATLI